jgi:hypothetical protein
LWTRWLITVITTAQRLYRSSDKLTQSTHSRPSCSRPMLILSSIILPGHTRNFLPSGFSTKILHLDKIQGLRGCRFDSRFNKIQQTMQASRPLDTILCQLILTAWGDRLLAVWRHASRQTHIHQHAATDSGLLSSYAMSDVSEEPSTFVVGVK